MPLDPKTLTAFVTGYGLVIMHNFLVVFCCAMVNKKCSTHITLEDTNSMDCLVCVERDFEGGGITTIVTLVTPGCWMGFFMAYSMGSPDDYLSTFENLPTLTTAI